MFPHYAAVTIAFILGAGVGIFSFRMPFIVLLIVNIFVLPLLTLI